MTENNNKETMRFDLTEEELEEVHQQILKERENLFKVFGRWSLLDVKVEDPGLARYIDLTPRIVLHTHGRLSQERFGKAKINIVERLINNMMRTGKYTGKKTKAYKVVKLAFEIIEKRTKQNPVQVLVKALENAAPREAVTNLKMGGVMIPRAVDVSPLRRLDMALRHIAIGAIQKSHKNKKRIWECLAEEIIYAANNNPQSFAIAKKDEIERIAKSSR